MWYVLERGVIGDKHPSWEVITWLRREKMRVMAAVMKRKPSVELAGPSVKSDKALHSNSLQQSLIHIINL